MNNLLNASDREAIIARLENLDENRRPGWGKMNVQQVVPHLTDPLRAAIGDRQVPMMPGIFSKFPVNQIVVWWMPWPKAAPTSPEFLPGTGGTAAAEFLQDKQTLLLTIHRFANHASEGRFSPSPVFGRLSNRAWGRLMWRHLDHHLRQFGV